MSSHYKYYTGVVVPQLVHHLSYDPKVDTPTPEQQLEVTHEMAQIAAQRINSKKGSWPKFHVEHAEDSPTGGKLTALYVEGDQLLAEFGVEDDVSTMIDGGAMVSLSLGTDMNQGDPSSFEVSELSLVHVPLRPGSIITHSHEDEDGATEEGALEPPPVLQESLPRLRVSASGTLQSVMSLSPAKAPKSKSNSAPMEVEETKEEQQQPKAKAPKKKESEQPQEDDDEEEDKKKKTTSAAFRPRRCLEDETEYMIKRLAAHPGLSGNLSQELIEHLSKREIALSEATKNATEREQKLLGYKARMSDAIVPAIQSFVQQLNAEQRVRVRASGTLEPLAQLLQPSSEQSSPPPSRPVAITTTMSTPDTANTTAEAPDVIGALFDQVKSTAHQGFDSISSPTNTPASLQQQLREQQKTIDTMAAILARIDDENEQKRRATQSKLEAIARRERQHESGRVGVKASATTTRAAEPSSTGNRRVSKKTVSKTAQSAIQNMRKARGPPPPQSRMQDEAGGEEEGDEEEQEQAEEEDEGQEEEEFKEEDEGRHYGKHEREEHKEYDHNAMQDEDEDDDEVVDIDDETYGELDRSLFRRDHMADDFQNSNVYRRAQEQQRARLANQPKRVRGSTPSNPLDPDNQHIVLHPKSLASYKKKREKIHPGKRIQVKASGTLGKEITPGQARESIRCGSAYQALVNPHLEKKINPYQLEKMYREAEAQKTAQFDDTSVNWGAGRFKNADDYARRCFRTFTNETAITSRPAEYRPHGIQLGGHNQHLL